jgi:hypothetical protein
MPIWIGNKLTYFFSVIEENANWVPLKLILPGVEK